MLHQRQSPALYQDLHCSIALKSVVIPHSLELFLVPFGSVFLLLLAALFLFAGWLHLQPKYRPSLAWFKSAEPRLNHHLAGLFGVSSLAWAGHLVHVAIPESRGVHVGWNNFLTTLPHPAGLAPFWRGDWGVYAQNPDTSGHIFGTSQGAGTAILTFLGGFHPQTESLWLTDMAHHHLAIVIDHRFKVDSTTTHFNNRFLVRVEYCFAPNTNSLLIPSCNR